MVSKMAPDPNNTMDYLLSATRNKMELKQDNVLEFKL